MKYFMLVVLSIMYVGSIAYAGSSGCKNTSNSRLSIFAGKDAAPKSTNAPGESDNR